MDPDRKNLMQRMELLRAYLEVFERPDDLLRVCATVEGDRDDALSAVSSAFEVSDIAADAILAMQIGRFTPRGVEQVRAQIADVERQLLDEA